MAADPVVSPADTPAWDYADVLDGPLYVAREPRDGDRPAIKSGHFTILTAGDYFDGGGPVIDRLEWLCQIANERPLLVEAAPAVSGRWHGLYAGTADEQAMVNREALAALLAERAALLAVGERDKAERERDRRQIARLTEALEWALDVLDNTQIGMHATPKYVAARAVLADEEDAPPEPQLCGWLQPHRAHEWRTFDNPATTYRCPGRAAGEGDAANG